MRKRSSYVILFLGAALFSGCGGSSDSKNSGPGNSGGSTNVDNFTPHNEYKLSPKLVQLDSTPGFSVVSVSDTSVVLQKAPALSPGQIILHNSLDDRAFCRKVVSSSVSGTTTTVQTSRAYMTDVFASANIAGRETVSQENLNKFKSMNPGVTISPATPEARAKLGLLSDSRVVKQGDALTFTFNNVQIYDSSNTKAVATVNGKISIFLGIDYEYKQGTFGPESFHLAPFFQIDGNLSASVVAAGSFEKEIPIVSSPPIPLGALAALGITGDVQLKLKVDGAFSANGNFAATASLRAGGGLQYSNGGFGVYPIEKHSFSMQGPNFDGAGHIGASLVRPQVAMRIPGIADLTATLDAARATIDVQSGYKNSDGKLGFKFRTQGELNAFLSGRVGLGPITIWQRTESYSIAKFDIDKATTFVPFPPSSSAGTIAYLAPDTRSIHFINPDGTNDRSIISAPSGAFLNSPTISPSGRRLAYYLGGTNASGIYFTAANGASPKRLDLKGLSSTGLSWKPDGTELAISGPDSKGVNQVYVYNLSTGARRQITNSSLSVRNPSWTPDGKEIYIDFSPNPAAGVIASFPSTGTNQISTTGRVNDPSQVLTRAVVSPDGKTVLMESAGLGLAVASTNASTSVATDIVRDLPSFFPGWSPDGNSIVSQIVDKGVSRIVTYTKTGSNRKAIVNGSNPSWGQSN